MVQMEMPESPAVQVKQRLPACCTVVELLQVVPMEMPKSPAVQVKRRLCAHTSDACSTSSREE